MALTTDYFRDLVTSETKSLNKLCEQWIHIMDNESNITEEGFGQIRSTIGKTNLFINQRFKQFNGLIDDCHLKRGAKETKVEDLQGFWDMIYFQIEDLHQLFDRLIQLKANKWQEIEIKPKPIAKKPSKVLPKHNTYKPIIRSKIREQIQKNMKNKECDKNVDKNESFGEKENKKNEILAKIEKPLIVSNVKTMEKHSENGSEVRNVLKRTPLRNAIKK